MTEIFLFVTTLGSHRASYPMVTQGCETEIKNVRSFISIAHTILLSMLLRHIEDNIITFLSLDVFGLLKRLFLWYIGYVASNGRMA
jgi:hypothetical protein